jgi:multiple sugar transport system substrate-binding protein
MEQVEGDMDMKRMVLFVCVCILVMAAGCNNNKIEQVRTISVITHLEEKEFIQLYGNAFAEKFPNIKIKYNKIPDNGDIETFQNFHKKYDVIMYDSGFEEYARSGKLMEIDRSLIDIDHMYPPVISQIQTLGGGGKIYGLANGFLTDAIMYDKQLFDHYHIDYPTNGMTWDQLLQLAKRFPNDKLGADRIYGFGMPGTPYELIDQIRKVYELSFFDAQGAVNLHTPEWKKLLQLVLDGYAGGYIVPALDPFPDPSKTTEPVLRAMLFMTGGGSMSMDNSQIVSAPVSPFSNKVTSLNLCEISSISSQTKYPDEALEFIKFITSEEVAKRNLPQSECLPTRIDLVPQHNAEALTPFVSAGLGDTGIPREEPLNTNDLYTVMFQPVGEAYVKLFAKEITLDDAIAMIEEKAKNTLDKMKLEKTTTQDVQR